MKQSLYTLGFVVLLGACSFHEKQPVNDAYYKKTQGITWPSEQKASKSTKAPQQVKKAADKTAAAATKVADTATTVSKTITTTTTTSETTTYTK